MNRSKRLRFFPACALAACLWPAAAMAGLTFEQTSIEIKAKMDDTEAKVEYRFANKGAATVTITDVQTSCGCTAAGLEKKIYAPGESGKIDVTFDFGSRVGVQTKSVSVRTDDPAQPQISLSLQVDIPDPVKISPRFLFWKKGESADPKIVRVEIEHDEPVTVSLARSDSPVIGVQVKTLTAGKLYELVLTPRSLDRNVSANVTLRTLFADGREKEHVLFARIYVPRTPPKPDNDATGTPAPTPETPATPATPATPETPAAQP